MCQGFISVVLGYVLSQHGVGVAVIAGLVGLRLLPDTWSFLAGPLIDSCLSCMRWYILSIVGLALCSVGFAFSPVEAANSALFAALCLASGITAVLSTSSASASLALTTTNAVRGACAGWRQAGWLGGMGLGGGGALWLATHAGGLRVAGLVVGMIYLLCVFPFLIVKVPTAIRGTSVAVAAQEALGALWKLLRTRPGILAVIAVTLPVMALALTSLSVSAQYLSLPQALLPVLIAIGIWGLTGWGFFPAQQVRLIGISGLRAAPVILSLNASFMYLGFSLGAVLGSFTLTRGSVADLGWVGGLCVMASFVLFLATHHKSERSAKP